MGAGQSQQSTDAGLENVRLQTQQQEDDDGADVYIPPAPPAGYTEERWLAERVRQNNGLQLERERQKAEGYDLPVGADPEAIARVNRVPVRDPRNQQGAKKEDLNGDALEYRFPSGSLYVGGFRDGLLHGYGKYLYAPSGDTYEGDWRQDRKHGFGTYIFASGDRYVGEWQHGMKHGKGIYTFRNGDTLRGSWDSDHVCGFGVFFAGSEGHAAGGVKYEGEWQQSFRHGFGSQQHLNGNLYEGRWYLGKEHGLGVLQYAQDGGLYVGDWNNGLQDGRGILVEGGQKYLVLFTAGVLEAKEPIGATDPVPPEFERAARAYQKWISRVRIPAGAVDDLPFSMDREGYDLLKTERDEWERRYRELMKHVAVAHDNDDWATESNPAALRERLRVALQQRDAERQRSDDLEAFTARVRALAAFGYTGNGTNDAGSKSRGGDFGGIGGEGQRAKLEAAEAELAALRGQQQQSARQRDKYNDAHRTILAQQAQIDELLRELAMQRQRATTLQAQANLDANNGGVGGSAVELSAEVKDLRAKLEQATGTSLALEEKAKKAQLRLTELEKLHAKAGDGDAAKLMADLAEARSTVQAQAARMDEMDAEYKRERRKHKRAAQDRDEAKSILLTVETESARALRQFRIAVGGKVLVLGSLDGAMAAQGVESSSAGASAVASQDVAGATIRLSEDRLGFVVDAAAGGAEQKIVLDAAFPLQRQEQELFDETRFAVRAVANGINASLVFFGPRGEESTKETLGKIAPRAFDELFKALTTLQSGFDVSVNASAIEVTAAGAVDLLSKTADNAPVKFMKDSFGTVVFSGATAVAVSDAGSANKALHSAIGRKAAHNAASNLIFTVQVRAEHVASKAVLVGKLIIADLCASFEPTDGAQYRRDAAASLAGAIETLSRGRPLEPRADDQLMLALSDSVGGNSRTFLICCVHNQLPVDAGLQRTLASARTATQIINQPMQHFESAEVAHLLDIVGRVAPAEKPPRVFEIIKP